jgi:Icc-related predicted phosphoesterase
MYYTFIKWLLWGNIMKYWEIYYIKADVASQYFGQEVKLYRLFEERAQCNAELGAIIDKQIDYITVSIPTTEMQRKLNQELHHDKYYRTDGEKHYIEKDRCSSQLEIGLKKIQIITSLGLCDTETVFFEIIRKYAANFFAVDVQMRHFGWLNPIKEVKFL